MVRSARERDLASIDASLAEAKDSWRGSRSSRPRQNRGSAPGSRRWAGASAILPRRNVRSARPGASAALIANLDQLTKSVAEKRTGARRAQPGAGHAGAGPLTPSQRSGGRGGRARRHAHEPRPSAGAAGQGAPGAERQSCRRAKRRQQLTSLDAELAHKKPLFARSVDLSREIATFDERCARSPLSAPSAPRSSAMWSPGLNSRPRARAPAHGRRRGSPTATAAAHALNLARPTANTAAPRLR